MPILVVLTTIGTLPNQHNSLSITLGNQLGIYAQMN